MDVSLGIRVLSFISDPTSPTHWSDRVKVPEGEQCESDDDGRRADGDVDGQHECFFGLVELVVYPALTLLGFLDCRDS